MFNVASIQGEEPAAQMAGNASRLLLLILGASPIVLFPVALAVRAYGYLFP